MALEYDISSDVAVIKETGSVSQCARVTQMYSGQITYDDEAGSKFATATINGKSQRVMLCIAVNGTVTYDDVPSLYSTVDGHRCLNIVTPTETGTPDDVPSLYETVVIDGQNVRAVRCIMINKTPVYDGVSSTCTFTGDDGKTHTAQLVNKITGGSVVVIIKGTSPLVLPDAIANSLSYVKAFGGTEQNGTPTPDAPVDIVSNNGVLKVNSQGQIYTDGTVETINAHGKNLLPPANIEENIATYYTDFPTNGRVGYHLSLKAGTYTFSVSSEDYTTYLRHKYSGQEWSSYSIISRNGGTTQTYTDDVEIAIYSGGSGNTIEYMLGRNVQVELGSTATEYTPYFNGGTATAEMLLKVGDYTDVQSILDGVVTRNVGIKVLDGTEDWVANTVSSGRLVFYITKVSIGSDSTVLPNGSPNIKSSHFETSTAAAQSLYGTVWAGGTAINFTAGDFCANLTAWKQWLAQQYAAGTPVIIIYPLATPTTESVAGQTLQVTDGDNTLTITQASLTGLELEAKYKAAVSLTIQEVEDANLDNNVEVTIS